MKCYGITWKNRRKAQGNKIPAGYVKKHFLKNFTQDESGFAQNPDLYTLQFLLVWYQPTYLYQDFTTWQINFQFSYQQREVA